MKSITCRIRSLEDRKIGCFLEIGKKGTRHSNYWRFLRGGLRLPVREGVWFYQGEPQKSAHTIHLMQKLPGIKPKPAHYTTLWTVAQLEGERLENIFDQVFCGQSRSGEGELPVTREPITWMLFRGCA